MTTNNEDTCACGTCKSEGLSAKLSSKLIKRPDLLFDKGDSNTEADKPFLTSMQIDA